MPCGIGLDINAAGPLWFIEKYPMAALICDRVTELKMIRRILLSLGAVWLICEPIGLSPPAMATIQKDLQDCNQAVDLDRQIAGCTRAMAFPPARSIRTALLNNRGSAWYSKGEFDRAIADFDEAIRLDPKNPSPHDGRGNAWVSKGEYDRAIADFNEAIRLDPKNSSNRSNRGFAWKQKGEFDRAIADFNDAIRLAPKWAGPYGSRGEVWRLKGDLDQSLTDLDQAVALDPTSTLVYARRGDTLRYKGEFARAIADYEHALQNSPSHDFIPALTGLGLTYEKMGDLAKAHAKFEEARDSQNRYRFLEPSPSSLETARAQLAALDSGVAPPTIPLSLPKAASATSIPTPTLSVPAAPPATTKADAAKQGRRVALVIGNSAYQNVPALANPQKDALAIAASLRNVGFEVIMSNDVTREKMVDSLRNFANEAEKSDWAVVYYAGHGMEVGGVNYLVPIDAKIAVDRDIQYEAVPLSQVLNAADTARKIKLVMLDACRDNPFTPRKTAAPEVVAASMSTAGAPITTRSSNGRGLAEVKVTGATLVVYAAKDGQVALDGDGGNSPFAVAVTQRVATPGVEINKIFRLVRDDVMEATAGRQEPYTYGSLPGKEDFFFVAR
jgi:tetratricopeptide (TPR) repeat protein